MAVRTCRAWVGDVEVGGTDSPDIMLIPGEYQTACVESFARNDAMIGRGTNFAKCSSSSLKIAICLSSEELT
jgi:hypothetical protein